VEKFRLKDQTIAILETTLEELKPGVVRNIGGQTKKVRFGIDWHDCSSFLKNSV